MDNGQPKKILKPLFCKRKKMLNDYTERRLELLKTHIDMSPNVK